MLNGSAHSPPRQSIISTSPPAAAEMSAPDALAACARLQAGRRRHAFERKGFRVSGSGTGTSAPDARAARARPHETPQDWVRAQDGMLLPLTAATTRGACCIGGLRAAAQGCPYSVSGLKVCHIMLLAAAHMSAGGCGALCAAAHGQRGGAKYKRNLLLVPLAPVLSNLFPGVTLWSITCVRSAWQARTASV